MICFRSGPEGEAAGTDPQARADPPEQRQAERGRGSGAVAQHEPDATEPKGDNPPGGRLLSSDGCDGLALRLVAW